MRVILLVIIITVSTLQVMLQTMHVSEVSGSPNTLNQTDIHDPASYAGKRLSEDNRLVCCLLSSDNLFPEAIIHGKTILQACFGGLQL